ncbi:thioredoxin domain-containing protein [Bacillus sp. FJAT-49705]|uniref:Thioredoxin domain-containing protein n=1 Tax=Cytobacillus citreus TaxID=2833586 RepID=A0ABS5P070_9BACI|nr:thioredoxin domain-containing protein [Cytobacillus citreus]MBS4193028.1 thioredoxin domain-containing protein [Cytobacillus citreus]
MQSFLSEERYSPTYNWLVQSKSPYLKQHEKNPVNWLEWSPEAFEKAKREEKPVFVSIGYSTCHWCHVMGRESFEDEETAKLLNERFISIKVDREERPDIDSIYMNVCEMMNGHGGWPLSVFLTPDQKPFYAGTYFPKESRYGTPGLKEVIIQLYDQFTNSRDRIETIAEDAKNALNQAERARGKDLPSVNSLNKAYQQLANGFNSIYGGFNDAPKFPIPHNLMFLLKYYHWKKNKHALHMVEKTLNGLASGGIYDHVGFGFARYSTDDIWLVPHFEKMLYDNALLLYVYSEAHQVTKNQRYKQIVEQIVSFIDREMTNEEGAFFSAIDADSEGVEGKYYVWSKEEIMDILGLEDGSLYCKVYNITENGNFEGKSIPNLIHTNFDKVFTSFNLSQEEGLVKLEESRVKLLEKRGCRIYPHLDNKILTSWNALMIAGLAKAGQALQNNTFIKKAEKAIQFIEQKLIQDGQLLARFREGEAKYQAYLDDWAFLLWAYIELFEATFSYTYLEKANMTAEKMMKLFWDDEAGGFFFTNIKSEQLIVREKQIYDGAIPSGNSVASLQMLRLGHLTGEVKWMDIADSMLKLYKQEVESYGAGHTYLLQSLLVKEMSVKEVVILGNKQEKLIKKLHAKFVPHITILAASDQNDVEKLRSRGYKQINDDLTVYVCENFTCQNPVFTVEEALKSIEIK